MTDDSKYKNFLIKITYRLYTSRKIETSYGTIALLMPYNDEDFVYAIHKYLLIGNFIKDRYTQFDSNIIGFNKVLLKPIEIMDLEPDNGIFSFIKYEFNERPPLELIRLPKPILHL